MIFCNQLSVVLLIVFSCVSAGELLNVPAPQHRQGCLSTFPDFYFTGIPKPVKFRQVNETLCEAHYEYNDSETLNLTCFIGLTPYELFKYVQLTFDDKIQNTLQLHSTNRTTFQTYKVGQTYNVGPNDNGKIIACQAQELGRPSQFNRRTMFVIQLRVSFEGLVKSTTTSPLPIPLWLVVLCLVVLAAALFSVGLMCWFCCYTVVCCPAQPTTENDQHDPDYTYMSGEGFPYYATRVLRAHRSSVRYEVPAVPPLPKHDPKDDCHTSTQYGMPIKQGV